MTIMTYKGYMAAVEIDPDVKVFAGRVLYLRDVIYFEGETVEDAEQQFHLSIDDYLAWAAEDGFKPNRPYSGKLTFRTDAGAPSQDRAGSGADGQEHQRVDG